MISEGKLDKHGRKNDSTPANWLESYKDIQASNGGGDANEAIIEKVRYY